MLNNGLYDRAGIINYYNLALVRDSYRKGGYHYIETPWWVPREVANITKPKDREDYYLSANNKVLVASGEQSFLYMMVKGMLAPGLKYQTITPCFRNETQDYTHRKNFMKLELIIPYQGHQNSLETLIEIAKLTFMEISGKSLELFTHREVKTEDNITVVNYDIEYNGIELGSYGIRKYKGLTWTYGTGIAEPRFSVAVGSKNE
jgi:elongation factor P--beta-lysine ligase